jgi:hypothetical protein
MVAHGIKPRYSGEAILTEEQDTRRTEKRYSFPLSDVLKGVINIIPLEPMYRTRSTDSVLKSHIVLAKSLVLRISKTSTLVIPFSAAESTLVKAPHGNAGVLE